MVTRSTFSCPDLSLIRSNGESRAWEWEDLSLVLAYLCEVVCPTACPECPCQGKGTFALLSLQGPGEAASQHLVKAVLLPSAWQVTSPWLAYYVLMSSDGESFMFICLYERQG